MKLWLIERTDETDYDETNAILVRAESKEDAKALALASHNRYSWGPTAEHEGFRSDNLKFTEVKVDGEPGVIIVDFRAG